MERNSDRAILYASDFLDIALLGAIVIAAGYSVATMGINTNGEPLLSPLAESLAALQTSGPAPEAIGFLLLAIGAFMILAGPLWYLVGRPLARHGYL